MGTAYESSRQSATQLDRIEGIAIETDRQIEENGVYSKRGLLSCLVFIVILGFVLRATLYWNVAQHVETAISPDSELYLDLGRHFSAAYIDSLPDHQADSLRRTPGYPLFCIFCVHFLGDRITSILVVQVVISTVTILATFVLASRLASSHVALVASLFLALEPLSITYTNYVRPETLFTFVLVCGTIAWVHSLDHEVRWYCCGVGFLLGVTVLIRPVTTYMAPFLCLADFFLRRRQVGRFALSACLCLGCVAPAGLWAARNHDLFDHFMISSIEGTNLFYYRAAGAIAEEQGHARLEVADILNARYRAELAACTNPAEMSAMEARLGKDLLWQHPWGFAVSTWKGGMRMLFGPGPAALAMLVKGRAEGKARDQKVLRTVLAFHLLLLYLLMAVGLYRWVRERRKQALIVIGIVLFYLLLVCAGPEAYSRFRLPMMPLLVIPVAAGSCYLLREFRRVVFERHKGKPEPSLISQTPEKLGTAENSL